MTFIFTDNGRVDLGKLSFEIVLWLSIGVECFCSEDCQLPVKPIYGDFHVEGNEATYYCRKGYGLLGDEIRNCRNGGWTGSPPVCVKAAAPVANNQDLNRWTDNDVTTCVFLSENFFKFHPSSISLLFRFDRSFSSAIIRIVMTRYLLGPHPIYINNAGCHKILKTEKIDYLKPNIMLYEYNCSLARIKTNTLEITIERNIRSLLCEIQILPIKDIACPLSELSSINASIIFDPKVYGKTATYGTAVIYECNENTRLQGSEIRYCIDGNKWSGNQTFCEDTTCPLSELSAVNANISFDRTVSGETATYGTAAIYTCNDNTTLRGSEVRYCADGNQWSGNQTFCEEESGSTSIVAKYFEVIIASSVAVGFVSIVITILMCIMLRRKCAKPTSSRDIQCDERGLSRISVIDHYYSTTNYDYTENGIRTSVEGDYDYCTVNDTATIEASTNWKFSRFSIKTPTSPVSLLDNEVYQGD